MTAAIDLTGTMYCPVCKAAVLRGDQIEGHCPQCGGELVEMPHIEETPPVGLT